MRSFLLALAFSLAVAAQVSAQKLAVDPTFTAPDLELPWLRLVQVDAKLTVYLADEATPMLLRLSANGGKVDTIAREGAGPGEVRGFAFMGWQRDSLWFYDNRQGRYTYLAPTGAFGRNENYGDRCTTSLPLAILLDGSCVQANSYRNVYARATDPTPPAAIFVWHAGRKSVDTIAHRNHTHSSMQFDGAGGGTMIVPQQFPDDEMIAATRNGDAILWVEPRAATSSATDSFSVRRWLPLTGWEPRKYITYRPRALERRVADSVFTAFGRRLEGEKLPVTVDSVLKRSYRPAFYPPVAELIPASDRTTWLRIEEVTDAPSQATWLVLDASLRPLRRVRAPIGMRVVDAQGDLIYGVVTDVDDVPTLVRYRVVPAQ